MKPLYIPKSKKIRGLNIVVFCSKCKTNMYEKCNFTGSALKNCPFGEKHRLKIYRPDPENPGKRITQTFETRNYDEAIKEVLKENKTHPATEQLKISTPEPSPQTFLQIPSNSATEMPLLTEAMAKYISFLNGDETVVSYERRSRSRDYCKEVERCFFRFVDCLKRSGYDVASLRVDQITKTMVGLFYDFLQTEIRYSNRSLNKNLSFLTSLLIWLNREGQSVHNPFASVVRKPTHTKIETISELEFQQLLEKTTLENGVELTPDKKRIHRNHFRVWLADAFQLGLFGRRREEIISMRFSHIIFENEKPVCIRVADFKSDRIRGIQNEDERKYNYTPISSSLFDLLNKLGLQEYIKTGKDNFILAPEIKSRRGKALCDSISRGFRHFFQLTGSKKDLHFKNLRKTYLTNLAVHLGGSPRAISGHSSDSVLTNHYLDPIALAKSQSLRNFEVFGNKEVSRISELNKARENRKEQKIEMER